MKKIAIVLFVVTLAGTVWAGPPAAPQWIKNSAGNLAPASGLGIEVSSIAVGTGGATFGGPVTVNDELSADSVVIGDAIAETAVEKPVWEVKDSNGDVVASMAVVCSDITDGSQDCSVKLYTMVAGTLTLDTTYDGP